MDCGPQKPLVEAWRRGAVAPLSYCRMLTVELAKTGWPAGGLIPRLVNLEGFHIDESLVQ